MVGDPEVMSRGATLDHLQRHPSMHQSEKKTNEEIEEERQRLREDYRRFYF